MALRTLPLGEPLSYTKGDVNALWCVPVGAPRLLYSNVIMEREGEGGDHSWTQKERASDRETDDR